MALNHLWWEGYFERVFGAQVRTFVSAVQHKLLPAFDDINKEADKVAEEEYERLGSMPADEYSGYDLADAADSAFNAGLVYYELMSGVKQGIVNVLAVSLYHLFEQQIYSFHRKELLNIYEEHDAKLFTWKIVQQRLQEHAIDITAFSSWTKIQELRLAANTVKHAEGPSSKDLQALRPDMFLHPDLDPNFMNTINNPGPVYNPLAGDDFYVTMKDFIAYADIILLFWKELSEAMGRA
jgi:hypothetical protein